MKKMVVIMLCAWLVLVAAAQAEHAVEALGYAEYEAQFTADGPLSEIEREAVSGLFKFSQDIDAYERLVDEAVLGAVAVDLRRVRALEQDGEALEDLIDQYENTLESSLRAQDYSVERFRAFDAELDRLDELLDAQEDRLEIYWDE